MAAIETRAAWGARTSKGTSYLAGTRGVKAHYTGGRVDPATLTDHAKCRALVKAFQNQHMDGNGWNDLGYSMAVCDHAVMIGRGPHVLPAANGSGLNSDHYAILVLVGNAGVTKITDNMKRHFHVARDYLRKHGNAGAEIKRHMDGYATDCPGPSVSAWVHAGAPLPTASKPAPAPQPATPSTTPQEERMDYGSFERTTAQDLPGGEWICVRWNKENADPYGSHSGDGETLLATPDKAADYALEAAVELGSVPVGTPVSLRASEYVYTPATPDAPAMDTLVEQGWPHTLPLPESGIVQFGAVGHVQKGRKLRVEVMVHADGTGYTIARAGAKYLAQR